MTTKRPTYVARPSYLMGSGSTKAVPVATLASAAAYYYCVYSVRGSARTLTTKTTDLSKAMHHASVQAASSPRGVAVELVIEKV
jgi:hypothetical protein